MFTNVSSATLRKIATLLKRKEALMAEIQDLDRQMERLKPVSWTHPARVDIRKAPARSTRGRQRRRGGLKRKP